MPLIVPTLLSFVVALIISAVIIYFTARLFGEKEGLLTAVLAALTGTVVYTVMYYVLGHGLAAAFVGGVVWLLTLQALYSVGWLKSLAIAVLVWIFTSIAALFLPALTGPL